MAVSVNITVKGRQAIKELEGVERQSDKNASADKRAAAEAARTSKAAQAAAEKTAAASKRAADKAAAAKIAAEKKAASETTKQVNKATSAKMAAEKKAAQDAARHAARTAATKEREAQRAARAAERAMQQEMRAADRLARHWQQVAQRSAAVRMRTENDSLMKRRRDAERTLRTAGGVAGGIVAGLAVGAASAANTARGVAGVQDAGTRVQQANMFRRSLIVTATDAKLGSDTGAIQKEILDTSRARGSDPLTVMTGLQRAHEEFNALSTFRQNMDLLNKAAVASLGEFDEFVGMTGNMRRAFDIDDKDFASTLGVVAGGASTGSVSPANFARAFSATAGIFGINTKQRGVEAARQFSATAQTVAAGGYSPDEAATRVERLVTDLNDNKTRQGLRNIGIKLNKEGQPLNMGDLVTQLMGNKQFQKSAVRQDIFKETRALQGIEALVSQGQKTAPGTVNFAQQYAASADLGASGLRDIDTKFGKLESDGLIDMSRQAVDMQADTIEHLAKYNDQVVAVTKATNEFEKALGMAGFWGGAIGGGTLAAGAGAVAAKYLGAGAGGAAAAAGGGVIAKTGLLATLGTGVTGAGSVGAGALLGGGLLAAGAGAGAGMLLDRAPKAFGSQEKLSDMLGGWLAKVAPWGDQSVAKGFEPEAAKIDVNVELQDKRTVATVKQRDRGNRVSTAAGPAVPTGTP